MNQIKGVAVTTPRKSAPDLYEDGDTFAVHDAGHLLVTMGSNRKIADYAPGSWTSVKVVTGE